MSDIKLIVGLANPGQQYADTRHNAGEWLIDRLSRRLGFSLKEENKFFGKTARARIGGQEVRFLVPTTYMNLSGKAIAALANFYRIKPEEILVIHDELDLPPGTGKIKQGGGHGGHNGLRDTIAQLGNNKNFYRLRVGIGHPGSKDLVVSYVLGKPSPTDNEKIQHFLDEATDCVEMIFTDGLAKATQRLHRFK